jgi:hypothetical protein
MDDDQQTGWLNEYVPYASGRLLRKLGANRDIPWVKRYEVLYPLARALKFNPDDLSLSSLEIIDRMIHPLGDVLNALGEDWVTVVDEERHLEVVREATRGLDPPALHQAIIDFRCGRERVNCEAREVVGILRAILERQLASRLVRLFSGVSKRKPTQTADFGAGR